MGRRRARQLVKASVVPNGTCSMPRYPDPTINRGAIIFRPGRAIEKSELESRSFADSSDLDFVPPGTSENSPLLQQWVRVPPRHQKSPGRGDRAVNRASSLRTRFRVF